MKRLNTGLKRDHKKFKREMLFGERERGKG
jgi:hypothetical protein